jgi:hypothetical protein
MPALQKQKKPGIRYNYIPMEEIQKYLDPILKNNGLCVVQLPETSQTGGVAIRTIVMDLESGEALETVFDLPKTDIKSVSDTQAIGASITYGKRYVLTSIFRIRGVDEDNDASDRPALASIGEMKYRASTMVNSSRLPEEKKSSLQRQIPFIEDRDVLAGICQTAEKAGGYL